MHLHLKVESPVARGSAEQALLVPEGQEADSRSGLHEGREAPVSIRMRSPEPAFHSHALKRVEEIYRRQLTDDPSDMVARISLAWCLFMQSLLRAGQESVLEALVDATEGREEPLEETMRSVLDQNATQLLEDCLRQTMTVKQLSGDPEAHVSAEKILSLVRLSGGGNALTSAEDQAARVLNEVTREVLGEQEGRKGRLRRRPSRRPDPGGP
jgi:hypothetical protein